MVKSSPSHGIEHGGWSFVIASDRLKLYCEDALQVTLPLAPKANGKRCALGPWRKVKRNHFSAAARGLGKVHVAVRHGRVAYWIET
ncbi:MAG: hypothetical protein QF735_11950, partial [Phycisphaeraceae bacterium]|nr:hypothetical protein [Phycisphaeraceae bacterium]